MADKTIAGLVTGSPESTDEFVVQKTGGGANEKYTLDAIRVAFRGAGEIHSNADYTMVGVSTTPVQLNGYDASDTAVGITALLTPDSGSNFGRFICNVGKSGVYRITFNIEVEAVINESIDFILNIDGVPTEFKTGVDLSGSSTDRGSAGINTFVTLADNNVVEMYINTDGSTMDILIDSLTFTAQRV